MQVDFSASGAADPEAVADAAVAAERDGYDGVTVPETRHDVFTTLALTARATTRVRLQSAIAVAFARNPMSVAIAANDIQLVSRGRFTLGLGSQVRAHIERRFGMPWGQPAARMEEFIGALRAIWSAWDTGGRLDFRGRYYQHTLMTSFFDPGPNPYGRPPVVLAAVGERMATVAGRVADGILCHAFTTPTYLRECTLPWLRRARGELTGFTVCLPALVVLGANEAERVAAERAVRAQIAFYASTPAYRPVLRLHGWDDRHERFHALARRQAWSGLADLVDDEMLDAFAVAGDAERVAAGLRDRFGGLVDRVSLYAPYSVATAQLLAVARALRAGH